MKEIVRCGEADFCELAELWERSVRASHDFLDEKTILEIREALVPDYFPHVTLYAVRDTDCGNDSFRGFIGLNGSMIEMLFIDGDCRGCGYGSDLMNFAISLGATQVDVNEQNVQALAFYIARGFRITGRDDTDEAGRPYPILHLSLAE